MDRVTGEIRDETLIADRSINWLYSTARERAPLLFRLVLNRRASLLLAWLHYDASLLSSRLSAAQLLRRIDHAECLEPIDADTSLRALFERQIRYWQCRPLPAEAFVVSPSDARMLIGSFSEQKILPVKEKFFDVAELLGGDKPYRRFEHGDWAIFRLTPEKYHYNHLPVSGTVIDFYEIDGAFHSCNPSAIVAVTPYSKNRRTVTLIDTEVDGGSKVGVVAMIEIAALMIGEIVQCYSVRRYEDAKPLAAGDFAHRGAVKSLFRPGSSTVVLLFEAGRIALQSDLIAFAARRDVRSRFSSHFTEPRVETDVRVRSAIARPRAKTGGR